MFNLFPFNYTNSNKIIFKVRSANRSRRLAKNSIGYTSPFFPYFSSSQQDFEDDNEDEGILRIGDVYLTKHSNLSSVQIIFHLVGDDKLEKEEISSRHPCVAGLHNIVRLSSRFAIRNISLPLLLVDQFNDEVNKKKICTKFF